MSAESRLEPKAARKGFVHIPNTHNSQVSFGVAPVLIALSSILLARKLKQRYPTKVIFKSVPPNMG